MSGQWDGLVDYLLPSLMDDLSLSSRPMFTMERTDFHKLFFDLHMCVRVYTHTHTKHTNACMHAHVHAPTQAQRIRYTIFQSSISSI